MIHAPTSRSRRSVERPRSTPPVRKLAKELGVDLALVEATGATGLITRADVEAYAARVGACIRTAGARRQERATPTPAERTTRIPIRGVRKHTAEAMVRSAFTAPHVTTFLTVDVTATSELIASLRADRALRGPPHRHHGRRRQGGVPRAHAPPRASTRAGTRTPARSSQHHYVNLGIAAATERGLVVPTSATPRR